MPLQRDLLSHRTGINTGSLILKAINFIQDPDWDPKDDALKFSREALIKKMMKTEAKDTFRLKHNYSNIGITAAAEHYKTPEAVRRTTFHIRPILFDQVNELVF